MVERLVFIGLGSNQSDRLGALQQALGLLARAGIEPSMKSSVYRSDPVEVVDQDEFLNQVAGCRTGRTPEEILHACLSVERSMGRVRTRRGGPRNIDLDLLLCGREIRDTEALRVPHPRMHLRRFALVPLVEIAPDAWHPVLEKTAVELLAACPDRSRVERIGGGERDGLLL